MIFDILMRVKIWPQMITKSHVPHSVKTHCAIGDISGDVYVFQQDIAPTHKITIFFEA